MVWCNVMWCRESVFWDTVYMLLLWVRCMIYVTTVVWSCSYQQISSSSDAVAYNVQYLCMRWMCQGHASRQSAVSLLRLKFVVVPLPGQTGRWCQLMVQVVHGSWAWNDCFDHNGHMCLPGLVKICQVVFETFRGTDFCDLFQLCVTLAFDLIPKVDRFNFGSQQVKVQGHSRLRLKIDFKAWQRRHSRPLWVGLTSFSNCGLYNL